MNKLWDARTPAEPDDTAQVHIATQGSKNQDQSPRSLQKCRRFVTNMLKAIHDINASMRSTNILRNSRSLEGLPGALTGIASESITPRIASTIAALCL